MQIVKNTLFVAFVLFCSALPAPAQTYTFGDWKYSRGSSNTATIEGYIGPGGAVTIPSVVDRRTVTYVTGIWAPLFGRSVTSVTIPNTVQFLSDKTFAFCTGLVSVSIPSSVRTIDRGSFRGCTNLVRIDVDSANTRYASIDGVLFNNSVTELWRYPQAKQGPYRIPDSVTSIAADAFQECNGLTRVTIPPTVTVIGGSLFFRCTALDTVVFMGAVPAITEISDPSSGFSFPGNPFTDANTNLSVFYLPGATGWQTTFANRAAQALLPKIYRTSFSSNLGFQFSWTGTGKVPVNVEWSQTLDGPWWPASVENSSGSFQDEFPPGDKAFYRLKPAP